MIKNLVEDHARESYSGIVKRFPDFCGCELCQADVMVYALNRLPSRYVSTAKGKAVTDMSLEKEQQRATIDVAIIDGIRRVTQSPRCGRAGAE